MTLPPALQFGAVPWALLQRLFVVAALLVGAAVALRLDDGRINARLQERFVRGVPWGTLVTVAGVLAVYLFVQGGYWHWRRPLVIPFRAWSYGEPLGMLVAGFAHAGPGHLLGNLFGALTLAPLVEYAVGHYPEERASPRGLATPSTRPRRERLVAFTRRPTVRAFVLFPLGVAVVGVLITLFTVGAVIGFSGVVFAFAGFALVRYPLATVLALVGSDLLNLVYNALRSPTITASGRSRFVTPWFADIAIQGHAIGLLLGVVLGVALMRYRGADVPSPARLFGGALLFATSQSLWAVYWYRGGTNYVLYRAVGLAAVALAAALIVVAVAGPERPLLASLGLGGDAGETATRPHEAALADSGGADNRASETEQRLGDISARQVGMAALVAVAAVLSGPAVAVNLVAAEGDLPGEPVEVRGYEVSYAEGVENRLVSTLPIELFGESTAVTASGVIVTNPDRDVWQAVIPRGRLAANGRATVVVGGLGWRDSVTAARDGWDAVGGGSAYRVAMVHDDERRTVFTSKPAWAEPRIGGQNVSVAVGGDGFQLHIAAGNETVRRPLPARNETVTVGNVSYTRTGRAVVAVQGDSRVTVFRAERYN